MNNNIYDISKLTSYQLDILNSLEDNDGEIIESDLIMIDDNMNSIKEQYQQLYYYVKYVQGEINTIKEEKNRLDDLIKRKEKAIDKIKKFMIDNIKTLHKNGLLEDDKIKTNTVTIFLVQKHDPKVIIDKENYEQILNYLPDELIQLETIRKPRLKDIAKVILDGEIEIDGITLENSEYVSWR